MLKAIGFVFVLLLCGQAWSDQPIQTPQIKSKQQTKQTDKNTEQASSNKNISDNPVFPSVSPISRGSTPEAKSYSQETGEQGTEFWSPFLGYRLKVTDTLLVVFTFGLFVATWYLYCATKKLVEGAENTAKRQLRAYISAETKPIRDANGIAIPGNISIKVHNNGQTPAHKMIAWVDSKILEFPLKNELPRPDDASLNVSSVLHPHKTIHLIPDIPEDDDGNISKIRNGTHAIYIWGEIAYIDVFQDHQITEFCFFMDKEGYRHQRFASYFNKNKAT